MCCSEALSMAQDGVVCDVGALDQRRGSIGLVGATWCTCSCHGPKGWLYGFVEPTTVKRWLNEI